MRIGELADRVGCDAPTIRFYEGEGVLPQPPRTATGYRRYSTEHVDRLRFVLHCRAVGITLADIKTLQQYQADPGGTCAGVNALLDQHIVRIHEQIEAMRILERQLVALRQSCRENLTAGECRILENLTTGVSTHHENRPEKSGKHDIMPHHER